MISIDTSLLFRGDSDTPIPYIESVTSLRKSYDKAHGLETGHYGIEMTKEESPAEFSLYGHWAEVYRRERIKEHYGLDFDSFLKRPRYKIEIMLDRVKLINDVDGAEAVRLRKEWEHQLNK